MPLFNKTYNAENHGKGGYIDGYWKEGLTEPITFKGSVQPLTSRENESLQIGKAGIGKVKVYSDTQLEVATDGGDEAGTIIIFSGKEYEIISEMEYTNDIINHFKYIAEYRKQQDEY